MTKSANKMIVAWTKSAP